MRNRDIRPDAVAIYIRWSTDEQGEGTTLEVQRERCGLFLRSQGWMVREDLVYVDEGYSGANLERPGMRRLRQAVDDGLVDCVVTYRLDRLSRNLVDTVNLIRQEWDGKCIYRSATEGFDTSNDSPTGNLIFNILASFAEFERAVIRERTQAGIRRRMKEGAYISGKAPFGYERVGKGLLRHKPGEKETVERIFAMATTAVGMSSQAIARKLNEEGIPTRDGGKWWPETIRGILRNPIYTGNMIYGRKNLPPTVPGGRGRYDADGDIIGTAEGVVPAIVSQETFEKAHATLRNRVESKPRHTNRSSEVYLLSSIGLCKCGGRLNIVKGRDDVLLYRCQRKSKGLLCPEKSVAFAAQPVEEQVVAALRARFGGSRREESLRVIRERFASNTRRKELETAIKGAEKRKTEVLNDLARLRREARQGQLKASTYEDLKADAESEMRELEQRLRDLQLQLTATRKDTEVLQRLEQAAAAIDEWDGLSPGERKELLRALCEELVIYYPGRGEPVEIQVKWVG